MAKNLGLAVLCVAVLIAVSTPIFAADLLFDSQKGLLTVTLRDGSKRTFEAGNNTVNPSADPTEIDAHGPAPKGKFPVQKPISTGSSGPYGPFFFPVGAVVKGNPADVARKRGIGIHGDRNGPNSVTLGCIRVYSDDDRKLFDINLTDPFGTIEIK